MGKDCLCILVFLTLVELFTLLSQGKAISAVPLYPMIKSIGACKCLSTMALFLDGTYFQICQNDRSIILSYSHRQIPANYCSMRAIGGAFTSRKPPNLYLERVFYKTSNYDPFP